jgi:hypothetical protein
VRSLNAAALSWPLIVDGGASVIVEWLSRGKPFDERLPT